MLLAGLGQLIGLLAAAPACGYTSPRVACDGSALNVGRHGWTVFEPSERLNSGDPGLYCRIGACSGIELPE